MYGWQRVFLICVRTYLAMFHLWRSKSLEWSPYLTLQQWGEKRQQNERRIWKLFTNFFAWNNYYTSDLSTVACLLATNEQPHEYKNNTLTAAGGNRPSWLGRLGDGASTTDGPDSPVVQRLVCKTNLTCRSTSTHHENNREHQVCLGGKQRKKLNFR